MPAPYTQEDYESLAYAVLAGMPQNEAEKTLEEQRKKGGKGEEVYWLTLQHETKYAKTSIQVTQGLKAALEERKLTKRESYEEVVRRIIEQAEKVPALEQVIEELKEKVKELEKQIVEDREMRG